jgi:hypothetical protein
MTNRPRRQFIIAILLLLRIILKHFAPALYSAVILSCNVFTAVTVTIAVV